MFFQKIRNGHVDWKDFLCGTPAKDYVFQVMGKYQLKRILDYLYQDSTLETRLNRKYAKYLDFLNELGASLSNL